MAYARDAYIQVHPREL